MLKRLIVLAFVTAVAAAQRKHVLVLNSYHQGYAWTDDVVRGVESSLAASKLPVQLFIEYLDYRRYSSEEDFRRVGDFLRDKYSRTDLDLIIASDDPAVRLLLARRKELFGETPAVFCGLNEYGANSDYVKKRTELRSWLTGVLEHVDLQATVDLALRLHPDTRAIVTIGEDDKTTYAADLARAHPQLKVSRITTSHLSLEEIEYHLEALRAGTIVILSAFTHDGVGRLLTLEESARYVCQRSKVPVYGLSRNLLGTGIVGGKVTDGYVQGVTAAGLGMAILKGTPPSALELQDTTANPFEFDAAQLRRWGIAERQLPAGSIVINAQRSFYALHPIWFWGGFTFFVFQTAAIFVLVVQVNRRREAERESALHAKLLGRTNYMLEQFAYVSSHDLQEPIRNVAIFAEVLGRRSGGELDADSRQALEVIVSSAKRLYEMVQGLIAWVASVEESTEEPVMCDSGLVLRHVIEKQKSRIEEMGAKIEVGELPVVPMRASHLARLWDNLLSNALRFTGKKAPEIRIFAERTGDEWKFSLEDSGIGVPAGLEQRVFGVFKRLRLDENPGLGMGLAICRRIVDHYAGRIWVEPAPQQGSIFHFTVPESRRKMPPLRASFR